MCEELGSLGSLGSHGEAIASTVSVDQDSEDQDEVVKKKT